MKYITHQRDEGFHIYESMEEAIRISRKAGVGLHISHLKLAHTKQWGESGKVLTRIREEQEKGLDLTYDTYPYTNGMTSLAYLIPSWCFEGEGVAHMLALLKDPEQRKIIEEEVQKKLLTLEAAVRKMTSLPAETLHLDRRGLLAEGYFADVVVFDADSVRDNATYNDPKTYTSGVSCVIVNGQLAMENGEQNDAVLAGRLLRRKA